MWNVNQSKIFIHALLIKIENGYKILTAKILGYIISISIALIAVAVFGIYGFEQTAIGFQTLYNIHMEGIAIGLGLILFSSIMFVFSINRKKTPIVMPKAVKINFNQMQE